MAFGAWLSTLGIAASLALVVGCRQDMHDQPKYKPLGASRFWDNGASARPLVENTVARGHLDDDVEFYTGKTTDGKLVEVLPLPFTFELLKRGQQRFDVYCSPCHDRLGSGRGMVVRRGFKAPPSYHIDRLRQAPVGYFFDVMTNGFGAMSDYRAQVEPADRWAIVAYIRALQRSQQATFADVPPEAAAKLKSGG
ncbi:MAG TPA: cytochrome c [Candidatus Binatia bacterium]|nr:cytochrome c [Candidatus Binatia bacterium]